MRTGWLASLALAGSMPSASAVVGLAGNEAPDFVLKSLDGENLRLSEQRGEVVILSFWASWCGDCRAGLRELAEIHHRYREVGLELFSISLDREEDEARRVAESLQVGYPVLHDAGLEVSRIYDVTSMPATLLIDRAGVVRDVFLGFRRGDEQQYLDRIQALLRE